MSRTALVILLLPVSLLAQQRDTRNISTAVGPNDVLVTVLSDEQGGRAVRRVSVSLQAGEIVAPRTVVTDDEGHAAFHGIAAGNYVITAFKPGYVRTYYGAKTPWRGPGVAVAVFNGKPVPEIRMKLIRGGVISGVVRTVGGRPAASLAVTATAERVLRAQSLEGLAESLVSMSMTDDRGIYRIFGLAPGPYIVSVQGSGVREDVRQVTAEQLQWADKAMASGTYSAPTADVSGPPALGQTAAYAPVFYPGTTIATDAVQVTIEPGQERLGVDFGLVLVPTAQIKGRVLDDQGRPQANASVSLKGTSQAASPIDLDFLTALMGGSSRTGPDGTFTINAVRPGRYTAGAQATIRPPNEAPPNAQNAQAQVMTEVMSGMFGGTNGGTHYASEDITVAGRDISDLTLVLRPSLSITGKVAFDATTMEVPKDLSTVKLSLSPMSDAGGMQAMMQSMLGGSVTVAADGTFTAKGLSPAKYRLLTPAALMQSIQLVPGFVEEGWTLKSVVLGGRDVADSGIEVKQANISNVVVTFTDHPAEISGTVFDQAGRITPDFPIIVFSTDRTAWVRGSRRIKLARPASDGRFRIVGLPAGEYFVCAVTGIEQNELNDPAFLEQLAAASFKITLRDGQKLTQDLKLGGG